MYHLEGQYGAGMSFDLEGTVLDAIIAAVATGSDERTHCKMKQKNVTQRGNDQAGHKSADI